MSVISGSPGVGKSSFIEALGEELTEKRGKTVAVLTIDPSSQVTGGEIDTSREYSQYISTSYLYLSWLAGNSVALVTHRAQIVYAHVTDSTLPSPFLLSRLSH